MEKSAVWAPVPKQKVSIVERKGPGWTGWLDSQGDGDCPICGTGSSSRHGLHVLRHTAAMRLLRAGVETSVIALWLGHEQVDTTQSTYTLTWK
jgi:hypothetical protein